MIEVRNLSQSISKHKILDNIDFSVAKGEVVSIIGPSGAGKTTFLRCINLLNTPDQGVIDFNGKVINFPRVKMKDVLEIRRKTAMVFQQYALFRNKTAFQNITEGLVVARKIDKERANEIAENLLKKVGLYEKRNAYPAELSGGQQQRIGISRALALDPELILFDEPTSALDPELVGDTLELIKNVAATRVKQAMIVVTHEMQFAHDVSDRIVFMENGAILDEGTPRQILENPQNPRIQNFLKSVRYN
ncbi:amino acid ABC transporter [Liquorilactobacillus sucicola DSM 21376 = JCM 15457]|uniref:L-cystine import ATP-binding protein n=1 Tax=Liquorilactobacillus sucicola DSM 21376 = JCM 15457 TaxID=1423806 RepID=A0A023CY92_9LACO|nr:amino acid ABC transporter ATP-binding protein [Liquorilactobacillus sucicola]KRN07504.1 L-cystine import ATP-binding protein [Liquorilactobacillus sucicola DSM 21376 = JCM 15457]GAJ26868.1 amino acid ABC transporter [Liquorilactobacillus sucicola DSM 21376 = JCM 15457]